MKPHAQLPVAHLRRLAGPIGAFTLVEVLITMVLFSLLLSGIISGTVYGLKMCEQTKAKLTRSDEARAAIRKLADEIRSSKMLHVGTVGADGVFRAVLDGQPQTGSALLIYPTTNTTQFTVYFLNADKTFRRTTSVTANAMALAASVTNAVIFRATDYLGNVLSNTQSKRVIHANLEFFKAKGQSPTDGYYKLETAVTRRALD